MLFAAFHDPKETISTMRTAAMQYEEFTANVIQNFSKSYIPYINGGNAQRQGKMNVIYLPLRDVLGRSQCHHLQAPCCFLVLFERECGLWAFAVLKTCSHDALKRRLNRNTALSNSYFFCFQPLYTSSGSTESAFAAFLYLWAFNATVIKYTFESRTTISWILP